MLSCCQDEDEDKILDSLVSAQGDFKNGNDLVSLHLKPYQLKNPNLLSGTRLLSCCQDEDEDKILDSLLSGQGGDELFQERERFGLTALEALSAEEYQCQRVFIGHFVTRATEDNIWHILRTMWNLSLVVRDETSNCKSCLSLLEELTVFEALSISLLHMVVGVKTKIHFVLGLGRTHKGT